MPITKLSPDQLARRCDPAGFSFTSTAELPTVPDIVGQPRATRAIEFGIDIDSPGYNIFVLGPSGSGRETAIRRFLDQKASGGCTPDDWVYVNNFVDPYKPRAIQLTPGLGKTLAQDVQAMMRRVQIDLPSAFETKDYEAASARITREFEQLRNEQFTAIDQQARQKNFALMQTPGGLLIVPTLDGEVAKPEALAKLSRKQQKQMETARLALEETLADAVRVVREQDKSTRIRLQELDRQVAAFTIGHLIDELRNKYAACPEVAEYLEEVRQDIIIHVDEFKGGQEGEGEGGQVPIGPDGAQPDLSLRYLVNVLVDNSEQSGAPVVIELNPTFNNLMGRIEHDVRFGGTVTDFTMLRPGAIHRANGGYLVLRGRDLLNDRDAYEALKRALANEKAVIEERGAQAGLISTVTLEPEPIPLEIKVVLLGSPSLYYLLYASDEDLRQLFKVKADFAIDMERTPDNELAYALFIRARCVEEGLRDFDASGVAAIVELGSRHAEHQGKLSTRFGDVADIVREASYWAGEAGHEQVTSEDVLRAMEEWRYRSNQVEERLCRLMLDGELMIDTQGLVTGQVNGLTVNSVGDYDFGQPSRITARTFAGSKGLVVIEREVKLSGRIHDKGVLILQGYLGGQYASSRPLALSASIGFEQLYNEIEGDSASSAELYALLSSLADLPVKQGIAVTGSVNQWGDIQPIGGAQYKIEGFFGLCAARGLDGEQGVIVPYQNTRHLMLRSGVVEAVAAGRFHVWAVHTVNEGIELLTGVAAGRRGGDGLYPPDSVHGRVEARLQALAETAEKKRNGKPGENNQGPEPDEETPEDIVDVPSDGVPPDDEPGDLPLDDVPLDD